MGIFWDFWRNMLKSIEVNHINAFRSIEMVDINRFNNAIIEKVNFNAPQLVYILTNWGILNEDLLSSRKTICYSTISTF